MLLDMGWSELMLIGMVALVVIGPKDLPKALRVAGFWVRKARTLSREFQSSVEQMVREAELDEVREQLKKASEINIDHEFRQAVDPTGSLAESLKPPELPNFSGPALPETYRDAPAVPEPADAAPPVIAPADGGAPDPEPSQAAPPAIAPAGGGAPDPDPPKP
ncbi:MAG TPA: Sec-independent protein translocase protein TatB [Stellaceae bacterium]|jgi:sec-independent protein translocase protein TatB|nr:Sec-independent protein translocase protein TatB [Stellaceae bacterium]